MSRHTTPLAVALFEAYSRNCGHNPDEHFDRNAAEQWMTQALEEVGVATLMAAARLSCELDRVTDGLRDALHTFTEATP